jgi:hypothetical protein
LGGTLPGTLFLRLLFLRLLFLRLLFLRLPFLRLPFLRLLFLGTLFSGSLFLGLPRGPFRGLRCGELSRRLRCLPPGLFCFQTCSLLRGLLRGAMGLLLRGQPRDAFRLAGIHFSGKLGQVRLLLLTSPDDCQILLFRGAPGVSRLNLFLFLLLLFFHGLLGAQANLLPRLRPCRRKIPVFCTVQIRP